MDANLHCSVLCETLLTKAFPFHMIVSDEGHILALGKSLSRTLPSIEKGHDKLLDHFQFQHPTGLESIREISEIKNKFLLLASKENPDLLLRGQLLTTEVSSNLVFLVSPWVTELGVLSSLGLTLHDFPHHSASSDFLMLIQSQRTSIKDSARLSEELSSLNKELESRVSRRTQALEEKAQELAQSNESLEHEMRERARVEMELRHVHKLEAVGQLAAGVAHEINTPMQYIGNSLQFIRSAFDDLSSLSISFETHIEAIDTDPSVRALKVSIEEADLDYVRERAPKAIDRALEGIARVTEIVSAMNEFTHPDRASKSPADINRALETTLTVASNEYKYIARIEKDLQILPNIHCFLGDLNQVFLNLLVNAAHAIDESNVEDGVITVKTWQENEAINISISDNGTGIPESIQHRVFDPFFTTKDVGRGTGQGLAISHKIIVDRHGGKLLLHTESGKGTTMQIILPVLDVDSNHDTNRPTDKLEKAA